jgi:hypothetical protein
MTCTLCQHLESELDRPQRAHAEKYGALRANVGKVHLDEYRRLQSNESDARLEMDILSVDLRQHKRSEHKAN